MDGSLSAIVSTWLAGAGICPKLLFGMSSVQVPLKFGWGPEGMEALAAGAAIAAEGSDASYTSVLSPLMVAEVMCEAIVMVLPSSAGEKVSLSVRSEPRRFVPSVKTTDDPSHAHLIFDRVMAPR